MELYNAPEVYERIVHYDTEKEVQVRLTNFIHFIVDKSQEAYMINVII